MMMYIRGLFALILMLSLTACGGGGGSAGSTSTAKLYTTAPGTLTIAPGASQTFTVGGGIPAYAAASSNGAAIVKLSGTTLTITGGGSGSATVTVTDTGGNAVNIVVTVGSGIPLFTSAPAAVTVGVGAQSSVYTIGGGSLIYSVTSSNSAIASVQLVGNSFVISGVVGGKATVTVSDTIGGLVNIVVTVGSTDPLFTSASANINVGLGAASTYTVGGGNGPYTADSSAPGVATASVVGKILTITGISVGTATVVVHDATTGSVQITVTVGSTASLFTSAPTNLTVGIGTSSPTFTIGGGSQVYTISSGNPQIATVGINGNKFTITGVVAGSTTVNVKDSLGANVLINVTIGSGVAFYTTAPNNITLTVGGSGTYVLGGGSAPYTATSSNTAVVTALVSGTNLTLTGVASGTGVVVLRDAAGVTIPINVTLGGGVANALFTTAPGAVTIAAGSSPTYQIGGGTAPYSVSTSNAAIATASISSGVNLTITAVGTGSANIVVKDVTGASVTIVVSIGSGAAVALFTSSPLTLSMAPGAAPTYTVGGGTGPYNAVSSDTRVVTSVVNGNSMTITAVAAGSATVRLSDSVGAVITITVTVTAGQNVPLSVSPGSYVSYVGDTMVISISGGSAPYTVVSSLPAIVTVTSGASLAAAGQATALLAKIGSANITVTDAQGNVSTVGVTVTAQVSNMVISPVAWNINETNNSVISLTISGGNGPFQVFTSNTVLSAVSGTNPDPLNPLTFSGRTVNVGLGTQGTRCVAADTPVTITVKDSLNVTATSTMTIKDLNGGAGC